MKSIKKWQQDVNEVSADMMNWALNFQEKRTEKQKEDDEAFVVKRKHFVSILLAALLFFGGVLFGYYLGIEVANGYFNPLIEATCGGCICL